MDSVRIAGASDLKPGEMKGVTLKNKEILLVHVNGMYYALENKCPHMSGVLSHGELNGETLTCPRHGAKFDVRTGESVGNAKLAFINVKVGNVKTYPVKVEGTDILVELD